VRQRSDLNAFADGLLAMIHRENSDAAMAAAVNIAELLTLARAALME
jgi:hypothetical protein